MNDLKTGRKTVLAITCILFVLCLFCSMKWFKAHIKSLTILHYFTMTRGNDFPSDDQYKASQKFVIEDMFANKSKKLINTKH